MLASQKTIITELFKNALAAVGAPENTKIVLERPKQQSHGDIACTVALQCAKAMKQPPRVIAEKLVEELRKETADSEMFSAIEIAGPGFINLKLAPFLKQDVVREILKEGPAYGCSDAHTGESILLEYVSANPTGPLHLGHARQGALGDVLSRMLKSQGWTVTREFYYNDAGNQIHNLAISVQARCYELQNKPFEFPEDGYKGAYVLDIAQDFLAKKPIHTFDGKVVESSGNPDDLENIRAYAVAYLREEQHKDLTALGVAFDNYYLESSLYSDGRVAKAVQAIRNAGKTYEKDRALWFKSTDYGDDKDRVMRKADGSYTYFVPDVAYHLAKFERGFNRALNIQGSDHHGTVARVRAGIQAASGDFGFNIPKTFPEYMLHKMLQVVKDGQPVKMSKRSGTYVTLSDLVNWVGKDAARLFMVNRRADAEFVFDVDLALSQSDENPVYYLQYAHARICSVFAQAQEKGIEVPSVEEMASEDLSSLTAPTELRLMSKLSDFPTALANGTEDLSPLALVTYLKELAADFHSFYNAERVLVDDEKLRNARLALLVATRQVLRNGLEILGVSAPERLSRADQPADSTK